MCWINKGKRWTLQSFFWIECERDLKKKKNRPKEGMHGFAMYFRVLVLKRDIDMYFYFYFLIMHYVLSVHTFTMFLCTTITAYVCMFLPLAKAEAKNLIKYLKFLSLYKIYIHDHKHTWCVYSPIYNFRKKCFFGTTEKMFNKIIDCLLVKHGLALFN